jgi:hypothetical protein
MDYLLVELFSGKSGKPIEIDKSQSDYSGKLKSTLASNIEFWHNNAGHFALIL